MGQKKNISERSMIAQDTDCGDGLETLHCVVRCNELCDNCICKLKIQIIINL